MDVSRVLQGTATPVRSPQTEVGEVTSRAPIHQESSQLNTSTEKEPEQRKILPYSKEDRAKMESMVEGLNEFLEPVETSVRFELHDKLERYYVTVVDKNTDEVVREIPPEKMLDMYAAMAEFMGILVDEKV